MKKRLLLVLVALFLAAESPATAQAARSDDASAEKDRPVPQLVQATPQIASVPLTGRVGTRLDLIHSGDKINVEVYHEPDLTGVFVVDSAGKINYPLLGEIYAEGLSLDELKGYLSEKLSADYIVNPQIQLTFQESPNKSIAVLGQVAKPGNYILAANSTLVRMISQIGGFQPDASTSDVKIVRTEEDGHKTPRIINVDKIMTGEAEDFPLEPGDLIFIGRTSPEAQQKETEKKQVIVTVIGQVNRPGNYDYTPNLTLVRAIAQAGGFTPVASTSNVRVVRRTVDPRGKVTVVNAGRIMAGQSEDYPLEPDDLIVVAESFF